MKAHIGVNADSGLLHGRETVDFGDAGYRGVDRREKGPELKLYVAMQPRKRRALNKTSAWQKLLEDAGG